MTSFITCNIFDFYPPWEPVLDLKHELDLPRLYFQCLRLGLWCKSDSVTSIVGMCGVTATSLLLWDSDNVECAMCCNSNWHFCTRWSQRSSAFPFTWNLGNSVTGTIMAFSYTIGLVNEFMKLSDSFRPSGFLEVACQIYLLQKVRQIDCSTGRRSVFSMLPWWHFIWGERLRCDYFQ